MSPSRPRATYRLQLGPELGFDRVAEIADYLAALGVSHVYLSPVLQAAPGSTHGYDVVDHGHVSAELGGEAAYVRLSTHLRELGLGQLLDIVPNHMAVHPRNPWWWDVLENGPSSLYAHFFDVEWAPPEERLRDKMLLPVLGDHAGKVIDAGEIRVVREGGAFVIRYHEHAAPVAPRSLAEPLGRAARRCGSPDLAFIADAVAALPLPTDLDFASLERRHRDKEVLRSQLERLAAESPVIARAVDEELATLNSDPAALDAFLGQQNCRLAYWRTAARDLGYRRFFDINSLVALRVEDPRVFAATHARVARWVAEGVVDGLRIDHIDGLHDPAAYLARLRELAPGAWIVVEKILEPGERLRGTWPVDGTTGYDFLNQVMGLLIWPTSEIALADGYAEFTGQRDAYADVAKAAKRAALAELFGSDLNRLTALFLAICEGRRHFRDFSRHEVHEALRETLACFPVYRSYVSPASSTPTDEDRQVVRAALAMAKDARPDIDGVLFDFLGDVLLGEAAGARENELLATFQQASGPIMAKGIEDTAFYSFARFAVLNEVGGAPDHFGVSSEGFHEACATRLAQHPRAQLATSTHDTKRSEDVRARMCLLSEIPERWLEAVSAWRALAEPHRAGDRPERALEYLYYQTLVGAWPLSRERAKAYLLKAARESKVRTSWTQPDAAYEAALAAFVDGTLGDEDFVAAIERFVAPLVAPGRDNALAQTLVKLTAPGVPDLYQGTELWDLSLVDPDNRRPVDFARRRDLLAALADLPPEDILARADEGLPKLWLIRQALALRARRPAAFDGTYEPLVARGARAEHVVAFIRAGEIATVVPRWPLRLGGDWRDTHVTLPPGPWRHELTGEAVDGGACPVAQLFARFPVALLSRQERS